MNARANKAARYTLGCLLAFGALNAFGGGIYGLLGAEGVPTDWLTGSPFSDYFVPSLILVVVVGGSLFGATVMVLAGLRWAKQAAAVAGLVLLGWLAAQVAIIDDLVRLTEKVAVLGLVPKPEIGIQLGARGASAVAELESEGQRPVDAVLQLGKRHLDAGAPVLMVESEGITESVRTWRTDVAARIATVLGTDRLMFEAADPQVFDWYIKNFGSEVNLFVDHSQIVQLESLRAGIWGTKDLWGRVVNYRP